MGIRKLNDQLASHIQSRLDAGETRADIAKTLHMSVSTVDRAKQWEFQETDNPIPQLDLNIDRMRAEIHKEMAEALRPFQERLSELDVVEKILKQESAALSRRNPVPPARRIRRSLKQRVIEEQQMEIKQDGIYKTMAQSPAILDAVGKSPGMNARELTEKLIEGSYPFISKKPIDSIYIAIRSLVLKNKLRSNHTEDGNRYWLSNALPEKIPGTQRTSMAHRVLQILHGSPEGMTRHAIKEALSEAGYRFTHPEPVMSVTWTLKHLMKAGQVERQGIKTGAIFSLKGHHDQKP